MKMKIIQSFLPLVLTNIIVLVPSTNFQIFDVTCLFIDQERKKNKEKGKLNQEKQIKIK